MMKLLGFLYLIGSLLVSQNAYAGSCADYPRRRGLDYIEVENGIKIFSTGQASVPVDDIDVESAAYDEAKLLAKSEIANFMSEIVSAKDSIASKMLTKIRINGESNSKSVDIEKAKTQLKSISAESIKQLIKGAPVIGSCYTPAKELRVTIGIKPETIAASEKLKGSIQGDINIKSSSNSTGINNMDGYSDTDRLNSF